MAVLDIDTNSIEGYRLYLRVKSLPRYRFSGRTAEVPDEYLSGLSLSAPKSLAGDYQPSPFLFDYQRGISALSIAKRKFAIFAEPGLGKTLMQLEWARHAARQIPRKHCVLLVAPLNVVQQTMEESARFYPDAAPLEQVRPANLQQWLTSGKTRLGITNYESIREGLDRGRLGALSCDESSILKSSYGAYGQRLIELGRGLHWKLCLTGTPAPNDRIEFANHAVFLDQFPTTNAFLARYFVNRGQTDNRWELKPHALRPFYRSLSHWCLFLTNPATYGWKDNLGTIPPIHVHVHDVDLTDQQRTAVVAMGGSIDGRPGGITKRSKLAQLAKGHVNGKDLATNKPGFIRDLIATWPTESTLVWCRYNAEQDVLAKVIPGVASISGKTKDAERQRILADFRAGTVRTLLSKPDILGLGLNLQIATRQVFNGLWDSWEDWWQCIKRSNRVGSTSDLNVHVPLTPIERPMYDTVIAKAARIDADTKEQEQLFKEMSCGLLA